MYKEMIYGIYCSIENNKSLFTLPHQKNEELSHRLIVIVIPSKWRLERSFLLRGNVKIFSSPCVDILDQILKNFVSKISNLISNFRKSFELKKILCPHMDYNNTKCSIVKKKKRIKRIRHEIFIRRKNSHSNELLKCLFKYLFLRHNVF